jgi:hypothetical protein
MKYCSSQNWTQTEKCEYRKFVCEIVLLYLGFEVLTLITVKSFNLWDVGLPASCLLYSLSMTWRQYVPLEHWFTFTGLHMLRSIRRNSVVLYHRHIGDSSFMKIVCKDNVALFVVQFSHRFSDHYKIDISIYKDC